MASHAAAQSVAQAAADHVKSVAPLFTPRIGIVLGSGLGALADQLEDAIHIPFKDLPGFPVSSVHGHAGKLVLGLLAGIPVACYQGRVHMYEGNPPHMLRVPTYTLKLIGCDLLLTSSAVGSLREEVGPGEIMCLTDHINFQGVNPLVGPNDPIGTRFPSMVDAYDPKLRKAMQKAASKTGIKVHEGVYLAVMGPMFETPAEIRAFRILGADVVGMSNVAEVVCARHCGLRVAAISVVVNLASGMTGQQLSHEETLHFSALASNKLIQLVTEFISKPDEWEV